MGISNYDKRRVRSRRKSGLHQFLKNQKNAPEESRNKSEVELETITPFPHKCPPRRPIPVKEQADSWNENNVSFPVKYTRIVKELSFEEYLKSIGKSTGKK
ncbi:MAG: hypothetical protein A3G93_08010 [Nitrospinae bacterium RIFCSPLOWO2_12_FULL_45_22]|nr:MAG: hypothetical protein A3G93_08010 [Nitrospinae bacterium RIFCSPLOWO2_12_FULL_45_22]